MMKDTAFKDTAMFILGAFAATVAMMCFLYPDLWLWHIRRLVITHETEIPFESTYILVSQFFHGGIQLWDRFDQVNNAFFVSTNGIYGVANVIAALVYILLSPFFTHPAEALYHTHVVVFYGITCLIRTIGGYVLLRKLVANKAVIFIGILYLNTVLTSYMMDPGLEQQGVYSFLPWLLYFILCFFEEPRLRTFLLGLLVMALSLLSSPYFTLGYYYQAAHFFILSCLGYFLLTQGWQKFKSRSACPKEELFKNMAIAASCFLILLPFYFWSQALTHDFYVHGSGLGHTQGRFNNVLNFKGYFNLFNKSFANAFEFLGTSLDYHHNFWGSTWAFYGASTELLALAGLVLCAERRKYIFASTIACIILINNAWFPGNWNYLNQAIPYADCNQFFWVRGMQVHHWFSYAVMGAATAVHAINALTNPFAFLVRSFHMTSLLAAMVFLPLAAMGLDAILALWTLPESVRVNRRWILAGLYAFIVLWALLGGTKGLWAGMTGPDEAAETLKLYIISMASIFFFLIVVPAFVKAPRAAWIFLGLIFFIDMVALKTYIPQYSHEPEQIIPTRFSPSYTHRAVIPDYQNPKILPLREYLSPVSNDIYPVIVGGSLCMYGAFYQYTPIGRFFHPWSIYEPRHISYQGLYPDRQIQQYLIQNPRLIFFAGPGGGAAPSRIYTAFLDWHKARVRQTQYGWEYVFDLPKDFPSFLSTTVLTYDHFNWRLTVGSRGLEPVQGALSEPWTYDVQNIHERQLVILFPDQAAGRAEIKLMAKWPQGIVDVWKNTYDDLGFSFQAPKSGWLVFNYPFDPKWELTIDGQKAPLTQVNRYFMGTPVARGTHKILLRYWPHTPLRFFIAVSMVISVISFFMLMFCSIKREPIHA